MFLGAFAQSLPDIDFISSAWENTSGALLAHRGFTHSILFLLIMSFFLAMVTDRFYHKYFIKWNFWLAFFGIELGVHLFIDLFNSYGLGLLEPFSRIRYSLNTVFVADPFFSIWPFIATIFLLILNNRDKRRKFWQIFGIVLSSVYLLYCVYNKIFIDKELKNIITKENIHPQEYFTTPTPFNNWLWYIVIKSNKGYYIGFRSVFDQSKIINFKYFPQNDSLLDEANDNEELQKLKRFSKGYYVIQKWKDTLVFNDLRFGQIMGWSNPEGRFVFHYYLHQMNQNNQFVVQRGRFEGWNRKTAVSLIKRILGD